MNKKAIIWTSDDCVTCRNIKQYLSEELGYDTEEREAEKLISGEDRDVDVIAQLADQNMQLPVIMIDGEFVNPANVQDLKRGANK